MKLEDEWFDQTTKRFCSVAESYQSANPFPHVVLENFWPHDFASQLASELRARPKERNAWQKFQNANESKHATKPGFAFVGQPEIVKTALRALNDPRMVSALAAASGIEQLHADEQYVGGGVHRIERGGFLKVHVDFNRHPQTREYRRLNLLVYMNADWKDDWGGHLQLWSQDKSVCTHRILPTLNRAVLFDTGAKSWHGHPEPLDCPASRARLSLATYYYAPSQGSQRRRPHSTRFM